ncbi:MAG: hypothetical protein KGL58_02855 [Pseudomonadota bacterium]|nr:hypothetical protein [Pseudomonadota bacterium]
MNDLLKQNQDMALAIELCQMGLRPGFVQEAIPSFKSQMLVGLYRKVQGKTPVKGNMPARDAKFLYSEHTTHRLCLHGSVLACSMERLLEHHFDDALVLKYAYEDYLHQIAKGEALINCNRAWTMVRALRAKKLELVPCSYCQARYVDGYRMRRNSCPICYQLKKRRSDFLNRPTEARNALFLPGKK